MYASFGPTELIIVIVALVCLAALVGLVVALVLIIRWAIARERS